MPPSHMFYMLVYEEVGMLNVYRPGGYNLPQGSPVPQDFVVFYVHPHNNDGADVNSLAVLATLYLQVQYGIADVEGLEEVGNEGVVARVCGVVWRAKGPLWGMVSLTLSGGVRGPILTRSVRLDGLLGERLGEELLVVILVVGVAWALSGVSVGSFCMEVQPVVGRVH